MELRNDLKMPVVGETQTTLSLPSYHPSSHRSPKCVMHHSTESIVEPLFLTRPHHDSQKANAGDIKLNPTMTNNDTPHNQRDVSKDSTLSTNKDSDNGNPWKRPRNHDVWMCPVSKKCSHTVNPVQSMVTQVAGRIRPASKRSDRKSPLSLASGDAVAVAGIPPCYAASQSIVKAALETSHATTYSNPCGTLPARTAIANYHSCPEGHVSPDDIIIANGCSGALDLALNSLLDVGTTLLVPQPGFPLYEEIARSIGANVVHYRLNPKRNWECDLSHLETIMENHSDVRAIVINNPSSATGSVFTENHLVSILDFARRHHIPIVSDEVYGGLTFESSKFIPLAQVAARAKSIVPFITASGISKQFLLPGWRLGWLAFHDNKYGSLTNVKVGATRLAHLYHGTSSLVQAAIPTLLDPQTPDLIIWRETFRRSLERRSQLLSRGLARCPGLTLIPAQGAMHAIIEIDVGILAFEHDLEFAMRLAEEENVFIVPGMSMGVPNVARLSFCTPETILVTALCRIECFCRRHLK